MIYAEYKENGQIEASIGADDLDILQNEFYSILRVLIEEVGIPPYAIIGLVATVMQQEDEEMENMINEELAELGNNETLPFATESPIPPMTGPEDKRGVVIQFPGNPKK